MTRILGHPLGLLERFESRIATLLVLPQQSSRAASGIKPPVASKPQSAVTADSRAKRMSSRIVSMPTPIQSRAQLAHAGETKANGNVAATGGGASERVVLEQVSLAGITDLNERAMFMAQMSHESNGFKRLVENLNYKPARLLAIFPAKFESLEDAQQVVGGGQAAIAERIYGNRKSLGNVHPGDGFRYRGRGIIQLTGRSNYRRAGQAIGIDLEANPDRAAELDVAVRAALWFWKDKDIGRHAQQGDVEKVTLLINGGKIGLADRQLEYSQWQKRLSQSSTQPSVNKLPLP
jgi:putative chitinase